MHTKQFKVLVKLGVICFYNTAEQSQHSEAQTATTFYQAGRSVGNKRLSSADVAVNVLINLETTMRNFINQKWLEGILSQCSPTKFGRPLEEKAAFDYNYI